MTVLVGYAREMKHGASLDEQVQALEAAGVIPRLLFKDVKPKRAKDKPTLEQRDYAILSLREGECLVVDGLFRLGRDVNDLRVAMRSISQRGAYVRDLSSPDALPQKLGESFEWIEAFWKARGEYINQKLKHARAERRRQGKDTGVRTRKDSPFENADTKKAIKADWNSPEMSQRDVASKWKTDTRTLKRHLGERRFPKTTTET